MRAYLNYPNSRVSTHGDPYCSHIQQARKPGQRCVFLEPKTLSAELGRFLEKQYSFAAQAATNDMWLDVDFGDSEFELAVVRYIHRLLGTRYRRFHDCQLEEHCP